MPKENSSFPSYVPLSLVAFNPMFINQLNQDLSLLVKKKQEGVGNYIHSRFC